MTHDPLCPLMIPGTIREAHRTYRCECALIAKVEERAALHHMRDEQADREIADAAGYRRGFAAGLDAAAEAVRAAGHTPFGVYDECECPEDVREQDGHGIELEDFYGCEKSRLYDVCRFCCSENDYHTEACATGHHHGPDKPYCTAVAAIDALRGDSC